jgi:hypothetical protein
MPALRCWAFSCAILVTGCGSAATDRSTAREPAVVLSASKQKVSVLANVTFTARIRPDLAATMQHSDHPGDPVLFEPHIIGWHWIPDIDLVDPWTTACDTRELSCRTSIHGSGTMVFSIRTRDQVCADWVHIDALSVPDVDEGMDSLPRLRADSISMAITTKAPSWRPCTA